MSDIVVLDLDRTVASFGATSRLFKRLCLTPPTPKNVAWALLMLVLMHGFWFWPAAVRLQRRIVMSLFARLPAVRFDAAVQTMIEEVVEDFRLVLGVKIASLLASADATYVVSHCPRPLADGLVATLDWQGAYAVEVADYLAGAPGDVFDKVDVLSALRERHPDTTMWYFADDLVDLPALRAVDVGTLVNGSWMSRWVCRTWFPEVRIW